MTVDIVGIGDHRLEFKDVPADRFESSPEKYTKIAKKLIASEASKYSESLTREMLSSDDIISNIATQIMMADWRWDSGYRSDNDKTRSQKSYRHQCGIWAIYGYIERRKKVHPNLSLSYIYDSSDGDEHTLQDYVADDKQKEPATQLIELEDSNQAKRDVARLIKKAKLSVNEELVLRLYYMKDESQVDIAEQLGITRQRVHQLLQGATKKLKEASNEE